MLESCKIVGRFDAGIDLLFDSALALKTKGCKVQLYNPLIYMENLLCHHHLVYQAAQIGTITV
jgi:hypothetical protein